MYIGRLGDGALPEDGIYVLLKEVIDNSIDEFKMKEGDRIEVDIEDNLRVSIVNAIKPNSASTPTDSGIGQQTLQKRADHIGAYLTVKAEGTQHTLTLTLKLHTEK